MHRLCLRTLDMRAGQINSNKAFDPGLIYDATGQDYVNLLCSLNNCRHPILKCSITLLYILSLLRLHILIIHPSSLYMVTLQDQSIEYFKGQLMLIKDLPFTKFN